MTFPTSTDNDYMARFLMSSALVVEQFLDPMIYAWGNIVLLAGGIGFYLFTQFVTDSAIDLTELIMQTALAVVYLWGLNQVY